MIKCKGCAGSIEYQSLASIKPLGEKDFYNAGPAAVHTMPYCEWFINVSAADLLAYLNVAEYKTQREPPLPGLATK